jgi:glycosyltransferase 2 family protein
MRKYLEYAWPVIGLAAVVFSFWLLYRELKIISASAVLDAFLAIPLRHWIGAIGATVVAYGALAWYDRIALLHLGRRLPWTVISLVSFTTYALSHNIGASVLSGAMVRLRAYGTMGLSIAEVGVLVALCSFTFALGTIILGGLVLVLQPEIVQRLFEIPTWTAFMAGAGMLIFVGLYLVGSYLELDPLRIGNFAIYYPRLPIAARQLIAAPLELMGAAGIIYFALPEAGNPGFFVVLGIFLASFSAALISHAPGGLGVLEFVFLKAIGDQIPQADVLAALIVFRLLYLLIPLAFGIVVVILFERSRLSETLRQRVAGKAAPGAGRE